LEGLLAQISAECYVFGVSARPTTATPEDFLRRAMAARTAGMRARWAQRGLATRSPLDKTTQAMLLRQLYLSRFETRRFREAHDVALQAAALDIMTDGLLRDAARAALAMGELDSAVSHLRTAAKRSPASRRPFHLWTLGSTLFLLHRYPEAIAALARAARWGARDKPLYRAHLALARIAGGEPVEDLQGAIDELSQAPCGQGYGRFVLGHLAYAGGEWGVAKRYLDAFVRRTAASRPAMSVALEPEVRMAKATLAKMSAN
jgi:tetratricopeptide (TPR) repeat protein